MVSAALKKIQAAEDARATADGMRSKEYAVPQVMLIASTVKELRYGMQFKACAAQELI